MDNRQLDILIAEKVMGQTDFSHLPVVWREDENTDGFVCPRCNTSGDDSNPCVLYYSSDIADAWQVVQKLKDKKRNGIPAGFTLEYDDYHKIWRCTFGRTMGFSGTAPLAICLAALKAVGVEVEND
jgi:hypothetical protein